MNRKSKTGPWPAGIAVFLPVPLIYLCLCFIYIYYSGSYATGGIDPEFNYLFNGILLSHLKLHLNAIGHPGTPIQVLIAIVARFVHLFRPGHTLWDDVILNPDLYIRAVVYTAGVINAAVLFITGRFVYRKTGSWVPSVILQLTPFAFLLTMEESYRMMPELIMPGIICLWIMLLVKILKDGEANSSRYPLLFGLLAGFSLSDKLTFLPFIILPLFVIRDTRLKIKFFGFTVLSFLVFAFPVLFNSQKFLSWVTNLFTHKGVYGMGEKGIIDPDTFLSNLKILKLNTVQLWLPAALLIVFLLFRVIKRKKWQPLDYISAGVISVLIVQYAITAKHYALYYMTPSLLLTVFAGYLVYETVKAGMKSAPAKWLPDSLLVIFAAALLFITAPRVVKQLKGLEERKQIKETAYLKFKPFLDKKSNIIAPGYFACSSPEYALTFGLLESGRYGRMVQKKIDNIYPGTIMYFAWADVFYRGVDEIDPVVEPGKEYTLLISDYSDEILKKITKALGDSLAGEVTITPLAESRETNEAAFAVIKH